MTNYREILRMNSLGFNKTEIAQSLTDLEIARAGNTFPKAMQQYKKRRY